MQNYLFANSLAADSHLSFRYFSSITKMHMAHPETATTTLYAAPIIFDRNAHSVPALVRVADILWCAAGISGLYRGSTTAPPTSVYSIPLQLADRVGGWDSDAESIGEDLHMYLKCFFALNGNLTCRTVIAPVSQSNVTAGKGAGIRGVYEDICARYKQAIRHMWGALDTGFAMRQFAEVVRERKHTSRAFRPLHKQTGDESEMFIPDSQVTGEEDEATNASGIYSDMTQDTLKGINYSRMFFLAHRLFEAHFLPVHMTILVLTTAVYLWVIDGRPDTYNLGWTFVVSNVLRTFGFFLVAFYLFLYESLHRICVTARERDMESAGLAEGMCFSHRSAKVNFVDYFMVPLVAPLFGAIPCAQAEICHFWTQNLVYTVSGKVTRQRAKSLTIADIA